MYKLSADEERELRDLVAKRVPFLKDASMDAIIDTGLLLEGFDSIMSIQEKKESDNVVSA